MYRSITLLPLAAWLVIASKTLHAQSCAVSNPHASFLVGSAKVIAGSPLAESLRDSLALPLIAESAVELVTNSSTCDSLRTAYWQAVAGDGDLPAPTRVVAVKMGTYWLVMDPDAPPIGHFRSAVILNSSLAVVGKITT